MKETSRRKFTIKIILSYAVLGLLAIIASYFVYTEVSTYTSSDILKENDEKLLMTSSLLTKIYGAENLSKLSLQEYNTKNSKRYLEKVDSIKAKIDSLKSIAENKKQLQLLDSVDLLLTNKTENIRELGRLRSKQLREKPLDSLLNKFTKMEESLGRITPESLNPNFEQLPPESQEVLREYVSFLNQNIPKDSTSKDYEKRVDSVLVASKTLLSEAKTSSQNIEWGLAQSEMALFRLDLELSQKLQRMISEIDREITVNNYVNEALKQRTLNRSIRLAGILALIGLVVVGIFTFMITRDFLKVQLLRKSLEEEKKYSDSLLKSREQLIATVSHDLRTPLNTISGYTDLLQERLEDKKQQKKLKEIQAATSYVENLVNDLLDYSKLEAGKISLKKTDININRLIKQTATANEKVYAKPGVELKLNLDPSFDMPILEDPTRLKQILGNLIGNAFKFTNSGYVKVSNTKIDGTQLAIIVEDTGIGIKKEQQQEIFKEFSQGEDPIEKKYAGYGLGLTISKKLALLLGGDIKLHSEEGKGSTFTLLLPLKFSEKGLPLQPPAEPHSSLSILLIDDDTSFLALINEMCVQHGHKTFVFNDFGNVPKNKAFEYDLVLTDIQMPVLDGFHVLRSLKSPAYKHYKNQPIIAMTGDRSREQKEYLNAGFTDVLQKPFSKTELLNKIYQKPPFKKQLPQSQPIKTKAIKEGEADLFDLELIGSFLGEDQGAINDVLDSFLKETRNNLERLTSAVQKEDCVTVKKIAHRMLPMFRQLRTKEIIPTLEHLEILEKDLPKEKLEQKFKKLKKDIEAVKLAIEKYLDYTSSL